jgi:hypothetical protein
VAYGLILEELERRQGQKKQLKSGDAKQSRPVAEPGAEPLMIPKVAERGGFEPPTPVLPV